MVRVGYISGVQAASAASSGHGSRTSIRGIDLFHTERLLRITCIEHGKDNAMETTTDAMYLTFRYCRGGRRKVDLTSGRCRSSQIQDAQGVQIVRHTYSHFLNGLRSCKPHSPLDNQGETHISKAVVLCMASTSTDSSSVNPHNTLEAFPRMRTRPGLCAFFSFNLMS